MSVQSILALFDLDGAVIHACRYGSGHINETYLVVTSRPHLYILQKVNPRVFPNPRNLMDNIILVTEYIRAKEKDPRRALTLVPARTGEKYVFDEENAVWRVYEFITGGVCPDRVESAADFEQSGVAFGGFQNQLADFPAGKLKEVIPDFHDTPKRYEALRRAIAEDKLGRVRQVQRELDGYLEREASAGVLMDLLRKGELPLRVTHNDTKSNNVMLDAETRRPLCVIDLDTVMPGLAASDFGDSIRYGASTGAEDESDIETIHLDMEMYRAFSRGFLSSCGEKLTQTEKETLPEGARLMTLECGVRFLTDYLAGDVYFHTDYPEHNLIRARSQLALVKDMETRWQDMRRALL